LPSPPRPALKISSALVGAPVAMSPRRMKQPTLLTSLMILLFTAGCGAAEDSQIDESEDSVIVQPPDPPDCDDGNPCTNDLPRVGGCRYTNVPNGTSCNDGNVCNGSEACYSGVCSRGPAMVCNDNNSCTNNSCHPTNGCQYTANFNDCNDGNACTVGDVCSSGTCRGSGSTSGTIGVPTISGVAVGAPPSSRLLERPPIYYLQGQIIDVAFDVPSCSYVTEVYLDNVRLYSDNRPGQTHRYSITRDLLDSTGGRRLTVRLNLSDTVTSGRASEVTYIVESDLGSTSFSLTLSRVDEVNPAELMLSIGELELHNALIADTYEQYGDDAEKPDCDPSPCLEGQPPDVTLYDPNYGETYMDIDADGIFFHHITHAYVPNWCNPTIYVEARFTINADLDVVWLEGPTADLDFPWYCDAIGGWLQAMIAGNAEDSTEANVRRSVQDQIGDMVEEQCGSNCAASISRIETASGEIRVFLERAVDAISVRVPYDPGLPFSSGVPFNANETLVFTTGQMVEGCSSATIPILCAGVHMGPNGTFNWQLPWDEAAAEGVPDGSSFPERVEARDELRGLSRSLSAMPAQDERVGVLLAKKESGEATQVIGSGGCRVDTTSAETLALIPNDRTSSNLALAYGNGTRRVGISFAPSYAPVRDCPTVE
jgi:hypothetical protein